jgi:hypothetical protein
MGLKFSGEWQIEIENDEIISDEGITTVGEHPCLNNDLDDEIDIKNRIIVSDEFKNLGNGWYHIYFEGILCYSNCNSFEHPLEIDVDTEINYINFQKL